MALDGLVISNIVYELSQTLTGGRINKIYQPEPDALILGIKNNRTNYKLLISASASLPLIYLTDDTPANPAVAPNFCMLLRKHINGGKILSITQPGLERILHFHIEHLNEMGDVCEKILIVELMGKHSNIIFCQPDMTIIDSIKHISANVSSIREVLPGRQYFIAETQHKLNPLEVDETSFIGKVLAQPLPVGKAIYTMITGISPLIAEELCFRASIDSGASTKALSELEQLHLYRTFEKLKEDIIEHRYQPNIVSDEGTPTEFSSTQLTCYGELQEEDFDSISEVLRYYYAARNAATRIRQRSSDLRRIVTTALERCRKKYALQEKQLKDTEKKDKYRIYGEMLNTYGYSLEPGAKSLKCINYYTNEEIQVPLDSQLSAHENSVKYFDRYAKLKRTWEALSVQIQETKDELEHLDSISTALDIAVSEDDLIQLKEELIQFGYIKRHYSGKKGNKKVRINSKPFHYISSDGFHMYVGKNNFQNEELTFKFATGNDWWFHAKGILGSHVIVKSEGQELPDRTFEEAGRLAAYYSKGRDAEKVEIDYIQKKQVKKTPGGKPGFVIYHTNYSLLIDPDIRNIQQVK